MTIYDDLNVNIIKSGQDVVSSIPNIQHDMVDTGNEPPISEDQLQGNSDKHNVVNLGISAQHTQVQKNGDQGNDKRVNNVKGKGKGDAGDNFKNAGP